MLRMKVSLKFVYNWRCCFKIPPQEFNAGCNAYIQCCAPANDGPAIVIRRALQLALNSCGGFYKQHRQFYMDFKGTFMNNITNF